MGQRSEGKVKTRGEIRGETAWGSKQRGGDEERGHWEKGGGVKLKRG